jgi:hypothetical protein
MQDRKEQWEETNNRHPSKKWCTKKRNASSHDSHFVRFYSGEDARGE